MKSRPHFLIAHLLAACATLAIASAAPNAQVDLTPAAARTTAADSPQDLPALVRLYSADQQSVGRFYDLPWSPAQFDRMEKLYREWAQRLAAVDFEKLDQQGRIDFILLRNEVRSEQARIALQRQRLGEMGELLPFRQVIQDFEQARWRMEPVDPQKAAAAISQIPDQIKKLRKRIEKPKKADGQHKSAREDNKADNATPESASKDKPAGAPLPVSASLARRTASAASELRGTLKTWSGFYDGFLPEFSWWMKKPGDEAASALEDYSKWLREEMAGLKGKDEDPLVGDPIGATALADDLAGEMLPYTAEEVVAIGEAEFAWCEARMKEAAREMGLGDDWKAALVKVKAGYVPPGQQDAAVLEAARSAIKFVREKDLVTVPPLAEEIWRMSMLSPDAQKTLPYAAYSGPNMLVAYAREDMKHEDKLMAMRGNNRHFTRIVTAHELIPGHHLQGFMAARHREYRRLFSTPFFVEGWALYWEMLLWDLNYAGTPEDRVGMLFWRMHRCARIIVSLKFHLGRMTPPEMVDFIVDRVGHERLGATSEVRRFIEGSYSPLYQCGYMIGGMQLRALRREVVESGQMNDRQFNDTVLTYGPIPVEMIRAGLLNIPLRRDGQAEWKFAGPQPEK